MQITETNWKGSLVELLDNINSIFDSLPKRGTKSFLERKTKIEKLMHEYNERVGFEAFNKTIK